jgi:hypothetical protein
MKVRLAWSTCLSGLMLAAACGSGDSSRIVSRIEAAGDRCPGGGVVVTSGADDDGDGSLDEDEVDTTDLLCSNSTLTRVDALPAGSVCPQGGTSIHVGADDNDNGLLDDAEIDTTQNLCKGTLVRSTTLGPEDAGCFGRGGVRLEIGIDDDGDDVLDVNEVDVSTVSCNNPGPAVAPGGPAGTATIEANGGNSGTLAGGVAGVINVIHGASGGSSLAVFRTGSVDTSFTMPVRTPVLGSNPFTVTANTNVSEVSCAVAGPAAGVLYTCNGTLYVSDGGNTGTQPAVTGLVINEGVTVTFLGAGVGLSISMTDDFVNNGTLTRTGTNRSIMLFTRAYLGGPASKIDLRGGTGAVGGSLDLRANELIVNEGAIDTSGGDGTASAGSAGQLVLTTNSGPLYNSGNLTARGGNASAATLGGSSAGIGLYALGGRLGNRGTLLTTGGSGTATTAISGNVEMYARPGDLVNSGRIDTSGGTPTGCTTGCTAGTGGTIYWRSFGGGVFNSGDLFSSGGSVDPAAGGTSCGGTGNNITIEVNVSDLSAVSTLNQGQIRMSGNIKMSGGNGNACAGRSSGNLSVFGAPLFPTGQEVLFLGYAKLSARGGSSAGAGGGQGGRIFLTRAETSPDTTIPLGPIVNDVDLDVAGGSSPVGVASFAGGGGLIQMKHDSTSPLHGLGSNRIITSGKLDAIGGSGGNGGSGAGYGATILYAPDGIDNNGPIDASGGSGAEVAARGGGKGGYVLLTSEIGTVRNTSTIKSDGGQAFNGGFGGRLCIEGAHVSNTGSMSANGGSGIGGNAGGGDEIVIMSFGQASAVGTVSATIGAGAGTPSPGRIEVDNQTDRCNFFF